MLCQEGLPISFFSPHRVKLTHRETKQSNIHSEKKVVPGTRNLRTNSASTMYYKVVITTMNK